MFLTFSRFLASLVLVSSLSAAVYAQPVDLMKRLKQGADACVINKPQYYDTGISAAVMYDLTKDTKYAEAAYRSSLSNFAGGVSTVINSRNNFREWAGRYLITYYLIRDGISSTNRLDFETKLNTMLADGLVKNKVGMRYDDTDQMASTYLAYMLGSVLLDSRWATVTVQRSQWEVTDYPMGGMPSTTIAPSKSVREAFEKFLESASDGIWGESGEYDSGTSRLVYEGVETLRRITGDQTLLSPSYDNFVKNSTKYCIHRYTSDLKQKYLYGDTQEGSHSGDIFHSDGSRLLELLAINKDKTYPEYLAIKPIATQIYNDTLARVGFVSLYPSPSTYYLFNKDEYPTLADWTKDLSTMFISQNESMAIVRDKWSPDGTTLFIHAPRKALIDHFVSYMSSYDLYSEGQWIVQSPKLYLTAYQYPWSSINNCPSIYGFQQLANRESTVSVNSQNQLEIFVKNSGRNLPFTSDKSPAYSPSVFAEVFERELTFDSTKLAILDVVKAKARDPRKLPNNNFLTSDNQKVISRNPPFYWHITTPSIPVINGNTATWTLPSGTVIRYTIISPENLSFILEDEKQILATEMIESRIDARKLGNRLSIKLDEATLAQGIELVVLAEIKKVDPYKDQRALLEQQIQETNLRVGQVSTAEATAVQQRNQLATQLAEIQKTVDTLQSKLSELQTKLENDKEKLRLFPKEIPVEVEKLVNWRIK